MMKKNNNLAVQVRPVKQGKNKLPFSCYHRESGCSTTFATEDERESHSLKCIWGLLRWCKESKCVESMEGRRGSLEGLLEHAIAQHDCVAVIENAGSMVLPVTLTKEFLNPAGKYFNARFLGTYEVKKDGSVFMFHIMALVQDDGPGERLLKLICAVFGDKDKSNNYIRLKIAVVDSEKNFIPCHGGWWHPSQKVQDGKEIIVSAIRTEDDVFNHIRNNWVPTYKIKDVMGKDTTELVNINVCFKLDLHQCIIYGLHDNVSMPEFYLTWSELGPAKKTFLTVDEDGEGEEDELPTFTGVLYPFLEAKQDLLLSYFDNEKVLDHVLALIGPGRLYEVEDLEEEDGTNKEKAKPVVLVLFPCVSMLFSVGFRVVEKAKSFGIRAATLVSSEDSFINCFQKHGCDFLLTTPSILMDVAQMKEANVKNTIFAQMKYMVVSDVDHFLRNNSTNGIKKCYLLIPKDKRKSVTHIVMAPYLRKTEMEEIVSNMLVSSECNAVVMGPEPFSLIRSMAINRNEVGERRTKVERVVNLIRTNFNDNSNRLVIMGNKNKHTYKAEFEQLMETLAKEFPGRHLLRRDEETAIREDCFKNFKTHPGCILLTSFYATQYDSVRLCDGIILYDEPATVSEMVRFVPFANKPMYILANYSCD